MKPILLLLVLAACACNGTSTATSNPANGPIYPVQLTVPGVGARGIFDVSLAEVPGTGRVWMSYSNVFSSARWPTQNPDVVSTRIAYSTDQGAHWTDSGIVNPYLDVELALTPPLNAGTWINEVSGLVYDPGAAIPGEKWKLLWHHYLDINDSRHFEHGWIGLKMAEYPEALAGAPEVKLFSGAGYDAGNNMATGGSKPPVIGPPAIALDTAISTQLNGCFFSEPGMLATASALYLSMSCAKSLTEHRIILLRCAAPCNMTSAGSWTYLGTALNDSDGTTMGFNQGFSAPNLVVSGGRTYLIVTGTTNTPFDSYYSGCRVFRFANLDTASLERSAGAPTVVASINGDAGSFNGACSYLPSAPKAGVIFGQAFIGSPEKFRLFLSGIGF